jgi:hypothetical protein
MMPSSTMRKTGCVGEGEIQGGGEGEGDDESEDGGKWVSLTSSELMK